MTYSAEYFIEKLEMTAHPEGGYYKETFVAKEEIRERKLWTSIYFLLKEGEVSNFHRLKSDEMWYYHGGSPLTIYMITEEGVLIEEKLGLNIEAGEKPQVLVPKNYIFGSAMNEEGYALVGCMVSPGFHFNDFELFEREDLLRSYTEYEEVIKKLTRE